jgi:hypothetical protein
MGIPGKAQKSCPSCSSKIAEDAVLCPICASDLGRCSNCRAWLVAGTECAKCGQGTAVRPRPAEAGAPAAGAGPEPPKIHFEADPLPLLPLLLLRLVLVAACLGAVVLAVAASELGPVTPFVRKYVAKPRIPWWALWSAVPVFLVLIGMAGSMIRRFRWKHTALYGQFVTMQLGFGALISNVLMTSFFVPLTAGVGWPWFHARFRQSFYRNCLMPGRGGKHIGFAGAGGEVLARLALSALLFPLGVASGGLLFGPIAWIWVKWEQSSLMFPDRTGRYSQVDFFGSFWAYLFRWMWGWLLSLLTLGIYRPWAKAAEWRWIAAHTQMP